MTAAIRRNGKPGVHMGAELQVLFIALVFLVATDIEVRCITTANAQYRNPYDRAMNPRPDPALQNFTTFQQFEADALNAVLKNWTSGGLNEQLFSILGWSPRQHPCNNSDGGWREAEGAWRGVTCYWDLKHSNSSGSYYNVTVIGLVLYGSNTSCSSEPNNTYGAISYQCGFEGIQGVLPSEIGQLTHLMLLNIQHHPKLTGEVPSHIWQLPNLLDLKLCNNHFSGMIKVDANGTLKHLELSHNNFGGTFSTGPYVDLRSVNLSKNSFTSIQLTSGGLFSIDVNDNKLTGLFPKEILLMLDLQTLDLSRNHFTGSFPIEVITISLINLDVSMNDFSGPLDFKHINPSEYYKPMYLNFSNNHFDGIFSSGVYLNPQKLDISHNNFNHINFDIFNGTINVYMPLLEELYMGNNNATGVFPIQIFKAPLLQALYADQNQFNVLQFPYVKYENFSLGRGIFLTNNKIKVIKFDSDGGSPYSKFNLELSSYLFLAGNPLCQKIDTPLLFAICRMNSSDNRLPHKVVQSSIRTKAIIAASTSTFGVILIIILIYVWRLMRRIRSLGVILREFDKREVKPYLYSYKDIKLATNNFDKRNKLGEGGFGVVYKGILFDGTMVAVKKLTMLSSQLLSEFLNEVVVIFGLIHRNLVKLKGCCLGDGDQRILVFEYVENKNLAEVLSLSGDKEEMIKPILDWASRFNIIAGIARGLAYLHEDLQSPIIHRDIKATNILLDKDYNPKIADFGLAYLFPTLKNNESHLTMEQVAGTRGYLAPEYALHGHMSTSLDVFSFGILVLEIICGRKNVDLQKTGEEIILQDWAWKLFKAQNGIALIDPRMEHSSLDVEDITHVIGVALACIQFKAASRPRMHEVGHMLLGNMPVNKFLRDLGSGALSFDIRSQKKLSWEHNNVSTDELSLCSNSHEIEVSISYNDDTLDQQSSEVKEVKS